MPLKNAEARKAYHRKYMKEYLKDPEAKARHLARTKKNDAVYKALGREVIKAFKSRGCAICLESEMCCLSAHHIDPSTKELSVGSAVRSGKSAQRIKTELLKCICLCENCHRKIHAGVLSILEAKAT